MIEKIAPPGGKGVRILGAIIAFFAVLTLIIVAVGTLMVLKLLMLEFRRSDEPWENGRNSGNDGSDEGEDH